jgi:amidohydrolase
MKNITLLICILLNFTAVSHAQPPKLLTKAKTLAQAAEPGMIELRHHFHQYPELSNREFKTAEKIAARLQELGLKVETGVAHTGVVAVLETGKPGPTVGLRADIDALPVTERVNLAWASKAVASYNNIESGVMHACGHDTHIAMMLAVAEVFSKMKGDLKGKLVFVFQPAEEGPPPGEEGGAKLMVKEGLLEKYGIDIMLGAHINAQTPVGQVTYKSEGTMAAADRWVMRVKGKQSHGSTPWTSVDPIVTSAQIIMGMQTIISRQTELTKEAAVLSVGLIRGGVRNNIIPEEVEMIGTIRTLDVAMQDKLHDDFRRTASLIAESAGATVELDIEKVVPITYNNPELTAQLVPYIQKAVGAENLQTRLAMTGAEDFSYFAQEVPSFYFFVGGCPAGQEPEKAAPHHTPDFYVDDSGMLTGVNAFLAATLGYMYAK